MYKALSSLSEQVKDYGEMKKRISTFSYIYFVFIGIVFFKELNIKIYQPMINYFSLSSFDIYPISLVFLLPTIVFIYPFYYEKSPLKNIYDIRKYWIDIKNIFIPFAVKLNQEDKIEKIKTLNKKDFKKLRNETFFKYTTSQKDNKIIDRHIIYDALTKYTNFWISLNYIIFSLILIIIFECFIDIGRIYILFIILILSILATIYLYVLATGVTKEEVSLILNDPDAKKEVENAFNKL